MDHIDATLLVESILRRVHPAEDQVRVLASALQHVLFVTTEDIPNAETQIKRAIETVKAARRVTPQD